MLHYIIFVPIFRPLKRISNLSFSSFWGAWTRTVSFLVGSYFVDGFKRPSFHVHDDHLIFGLTGLWKNLLENIWLQIKKYLCKMNLQTKLIIRSSGCGIFLDHLVVSISIVSGTYSVVGTCLVTRVTLDRSTSEH